MRRDIKADERKAAGAGWLLGGEDIEGEEVEGIKQGQDIVCVNAAMYAKLSYIPWVDFPPQNSHPLEDWLAIYNSLEDCLRNE